MNRIVVGNLSSFLCFFCAGLAMWAAACSSPSYAIPEPSDHTKGGSAFGGFGGTGARAGASGSVAAAGLAGSNAAGAGTGGANLGTTSCRTDAECAQLRVSRTCDTANEVCVECLPGRTTCGAGLYCGADKECHIGCSANTDCKTANCDTLQHLCAGCVSNSDCGIGTHCNQATSTCVATCDNSTQCPTGWTCCSGSCVNLELSEANCGSCGTTCERPNAQMKCGEASCFLDGCKAGYANCNDKLSDGCETDTTTQATDCGACNHRCATGYVCKGGECAAPDCGSGYKDCDSRADNGCETNVQRDVFNCGGCSSPCSMANGTPSCDAGVCSMTCTSGWGDCDKYPTNGCEAEFRSDVLHCGRCDFPCSNAHGSTSCEAGKCTPSCLTGYGDCDGVPANGCETNVLTDLANCGVCGGACSLPNATATCSAGKCSVVSCANGWYDCNGVAEDGCEVNLLSNIDHCGKCNSPCSRTNGTATCSQGKCAIACSTNFGNCDESTLPNNGCETDLSKTVAHCGNCETSCTDKPNGVAACVTSSCGVSCAAGFGNCNTDLNDGCETDTLTSLSHCGGCNKPCDGKCVNGACIATPCTGICSNPTVFSGARQFTPGSSAFCYETTSQLAGGNCGNFASGRVPYVNGVAVSCSNGNWALPGAIPISNGGYCIKGEAGGTVTAWI